MAAEIPTNTASATSSRLVKYGRLRRRHGGGYALAEPAPNAVEPRVTPATDAASATTETEAPAPTETTRPQ